MSEYASLRKRLRQEAQEWCVNCCYRGGDCICMAPDDRKKDCDIYTKLQAADAIEDLENKLSLWRQDKISRWIPVTERLPSEELAFYLCYTDAGIVVECLWTNNKYGLGPFGDWGWRLMDVPQYQKITHWMPLPEPPEEETDAGNQG